MYILKQFIDCRPRVYSWIKFQYFIKWLFVISGFSVLGFLCYKLIAGSTAKSNPVQADVLIKQGVENENLYMIVICILFFMLAWYCQKIINRNRYILHLENMLEDKFG